MMDEAAAREIERLRLEASQARHKANFWRGQCEIREQHCQKVESQLAESERQRKQLSEYIETLANGGIEAATGAGK